MAIGSYFAFIIFVMGTMSSDFMNDEERQKFYQDILKAHNEIRSWHHDKFLELDQKICDMLKKHTDKLEANQESQIPSNYGTNDFTLEFVDKPILFAKEIVSLWYHIENYNYFMEPKSTSKEIDAFTQIVWKDTKCIGVGTLIKDNKFTIIVAYSPKGNIKGKYKKNVSYPRTIFKKNDP